MDIDYKKVWDSIEDEMKEMQKQDITICHTCGCPMDKFDTVEVILNDDLTITLVELWECSNDQCDNYIHITNIHEYEENPKVQTITFEYH